METEIKGPLAQGKGHITDFFHRSANPHKVI